MQKQYCRRRVRFKEGLSNTDRRTILKLVHVPFGQELLPYAAGRALIVTADDFGAARNINRGILFSVDRGLVTTVSAMTSFAESLSELEALHTSFPATGIGVHLNITTGSPITNPAEIPTLVEQDGDFVPVERILARIRAISLAELRLELKAQIEMLRIRGVPLDHLSDHHGILSLYPPFFDVVMSLAQEYGVPVRTPVAASIRYPRLYGRAPTRRKAHQIAARFGLRHPFKAARLVGHASLREMQRKELELDARGIGHPDCFIDYFWGRACVQDFLYILRNLAPGISELVVHVGDYERQADYPSGLDLDYFEKRERELAVVCSSYVGEYAKYLRVRLARYSDCA